MLRLLLSITLIFVTFTSIFAASGPPNIVFPIADQLLPVAHVNRSWTFTLLPGTFNASSGSTIALSSVNLPKWVLFDASTFTFSGLPQDLDKGEFSVGVQANASASAEGVTSYFTLLVVEEGVAFLRLPLITQLPHASKLGGGATLTVDGALIVPPSRTFSIGFQQYTYQGYEFQKIYYRAHETGTSYLPPWLKFDNETVTFNGLAPSTVGEYSITIFGSEYFGYGDLEQTFKLQVGLHSFALIAPLPALNTTISDTVNYVVPLENLRLDNHTVTAANLSSTNVNLSSFPYLSYNYSTMVISGTLPSTLTPSNLEIPVVFTDIFNDTIATNITLMISSSLFTFPILPTANAIAGKPFVLDVSTYVASHEAVYSATISPSTSQSWLSFDPVKLSLFGTPPSNVAGNTTISFAAANNVTGLRSTATLLLRVALVDPSSTAPPTTSSTAAASGQSGGLSHQALLAVVLSLGIFGVLVLLALIGLCFRRYLSDGEQRMRREGSTLIFDDAAIAAAQRRSDKEPKSTSRVNIFSSRSGKMAEKEEKAASPGWGRPEEEVRGTIADDERAEGEAAAAVASVNRSTSKPRRFDLMGIFRGSSKKVSSISLPISQNSLENSLFGLGIGESPARQAVLVMSNMTPETRQAARQARVAHPPTGDESSDLERSSSWESNGSSSIFYSEGSDSEGRRARRPNAAPAAPRQRRDFVPMPIRIPPNSSSDSSLGEGIRLVDGDSTESTDILDPSLFPLPFPPIPAVIASNRVSTIPSPRLVPFSNQGQPSYIDSPTRRLSTQSAQRNRDPAMEDADEENLARRSALYEPAMAPGSPTSSAIYFTGAPETWPPSPSVYDGASTHERTRFVGSVASSPYTYESSAPRTPTSPFHRHTASYTEPEHIRVKINEPLRFTPRLNPPPTVTISSSPSQAGPPKSAYYAYRDDPRDHPKDRQPLPDWIKFEEGILQLVGQPLPRHIGNLAILIVERKTAQAPGSPTRRGSSSSRNSSLRPGSVLLPEKESEKIVCRMVLEVGWRGPRDEMMKEVTGGMEEVDELQMITY